MKKLFTTLSNIWKIEDLRARILFTLLCLLIYRIGSFIVIPGVDPASLDDQQAKEGLLGLLNMFAGGSFSRASIFALGVMPYMFVHRSVRMHVYYLSQFLPSLPCVY